MDDILWVFERISQAFQELRQTVNAVWDDQAARDVNSLFLDSHAEDANSLVTEYSDQKDSSDQSNAHIEEANTHIRRIKTKIEDIAFYIKDISSKSRDAQEMLEKSRQYQSEAKSRFADIESLINSANTCWTED